MSDEEETVWVLSHIRGGPRPRLHTDPNCRCLQWTDRVANEKPKSVFSDQREMCHICEPTLTKPTPNSGQTPEQLKATIENDRAVMRVIELEGPVSKRDIELEALLSSGATKRTLNRLQDKGRIEEVENPDDGRIPLYRINLDLGMDGRDSARAQVTPTTIGLLTVLTGLWVLVVVYLCVGVMV